MWYIITFMTLFCIYLPILDNREFVFINQSINQSITNSSGFPVYLANPLFEMQVPLPTAMPTLVEELEGYS